MFNPIYAVALGVSVVVCGISSVCAGGSGDGIVAIEGYSHGVALCVGDVEDVDIEPLGDDGYMWIEDGIQYVVNAGHMGDDEVIRLVKTATVYCAQYR